MNLFKMTKGQKLECKSLRGLELPIVPPKQTNKNRRTRRKSQKTADAWNGFVLRGSAYEPASPISLREIIFPLRSKAAVTFLYGTLRFSAPLIGCGFPGVIVAALLFPSFLLAQRVQDEVGFELGPLRIRPVAEVLGAYDNRVVIAGNGDADGDLFSELAAALYLENNPARYDFSANAGYGYRFYREYTELDDDFYQAGLAIASDDRLLKLGLSSYLKKTLDYDTLYETSSGQGPGAILTGDISTRYTTEANIAYEKNLTDRTSITPGYNAWYYFQDFENDDDAEWMVHRASLQLGYGYTEKTRMFLTGYYSLQTNDDEDGNIGAVTVGAEGRMSDKSSWLAHIGVAAADYELSGADQGVVGLLRANWNTTEKLSTYIYGSSNFQPGYNGGAARRVYRLGYGATWRVVARWSILGQVLHDYQEGLGDTEIGRASCRERV